MRLATYNVHHGAPARGPVAFDQTLDVCRALDADVLAVQELDADVARSGRIDQPTILATTLGMRSCFAVTVRIGSMGRYGHALLSTHELDDIEVVPLAVTEGREARAAILATTVIGGVPLVVGAVHLENARRGDRGEPAASAQAQHVLRLVAERATVTGHAAVVLGDLNLDAPLTRALATDAGFELAGGPNTYPSGGPRHRIDHVAARGLTVTSVEVPASDASDHRPLLVTARPGPSSQPSSPHASQAVDPH